MTVDNSSVRYDHMQAELVEIDNIMQEQNVMQRAKDFGMPYIDISKIPIDLSIINIVKKEESKDAMIIPFFLVGDKLKVAAVDPNKKETIKVIEELQKKGFKVQVHLCSKNGFIESLEHYDKITIQDTVDIDREFEKEINEGYEIEIKNLISLQDKLKNASSKDILNLIIIGALKTKASDIHIDPMEHFVQLRYRIDGKMMDIFMITKKVYDDVLSQIKYQARVKLNIKNLPQDGRIEFKIKDRGIDLRVSTLPTEYGETIVMRVLDSNNKDLFLNFESLGLFDENLDRMKRIITKPYGVLIITGPTGSGKTTTLYSILNNLNKPDVNVITLEDPVEYRIKGLNQVLIRDDIGLTFAKALRAVLRQDPDIVMVGEIRDIEVGDIAMQASLTGHIVLTTLHTNDAISAIPRLINMGIGPYMVAPALSGLMAQRLVRRPCKHCSKIVPLDSIDKKDLEYITAKIDKYKEITGKDITHEFQVPIVAGCDLCSGTGFSGRIAIYEILEIDDEIREMIIQQKTQSEIFHYSFTKKQFYTMDIDGVLKVIRGLTTVSEVRRVAG